MQKQPLAFARRHFLALCAATPVLSKLVASIEPSVGGELLPDHSPLRFAPLPEADLASELERLLKFVEPKLLHRYQQIAPETNAWPLWDKAAACYVNYSSDHELSAAWDKLYNDPASTSDDERKRIEQWLAQNEQCRQLIDQGIARGALELPRATKSVAIEALSLTGNMALRELAMLKSTSALLSLVRGDATSALDEATSILQIGSILIRSECVNIDYLVATALTGIGAHTAFQIAMSDYVDDRTARSAIDRIAEARISFEQFQRTYRVEFCRWFLPWIAEMPSGNRPVEQAACLILGRFVQESERQPHPLEQEYRRSIRETAFLLDGHPSLLDNVATTKLASELFAQELAETDPLIDRSAQKALRALSQELAAWPPGVAPDSWLLSGLTYNDPDAPKPPKKPTERELRRARRELRSVDNLLGKLLIAQGVSFLPPWTHPMHEARLDAARLRIAFRLHQKQAGQLPNSLEDLVAAGLLPEVPRDPYNAKLFQYSPERRTIWCVGQWGRNNGVIPDSQEDVEDIDMTWRV